MARKNPVPINKEDFDKLIEAAKKDLEKHWRPRKKKYDNRGFVIREYIIAMCLGFGAGMRISEIFGLQKEQNYKYQKKDGTKIDTILKSNIPALTPDKIEEKYIRVISGKGKKDRTVPLPVKIFRKAGITRKILLDSLPLKVSYRSMQDYISKLSSRVLKKHTTFHQLRHGFITHLLNQGVPPHQVMIFSGHSKMDTLGIYAHSNPKEALDAYEEVF